MILNTWYEEEVNGQVIGKYVYAGALYYDGRKQGNTLYAESEAALKDVAEANLRNLKMDCGAVFRDIFPHDTWELRIYDA